MLVHMVFESIDDKIRDIILKSQFLGNISALFIYVPDRTNDQAFYLQVYSWCPDQKVFSLEEV